MRVLAVAAHPDDETLGAGGTLIKHIARGDDVIWLITTKPHADDWPAEVVQQCARQVETVSKAYRVADTIELGYPAAAMERTPKRAMIDAMSKTLQAVNPDRIYSVGPTDVHDDHRTTFEVLMLASKPFQAVSGIKGIYTFEVLSSTEAALDWRDTPFVPNVYSEITEQIDRKIEIMSLFENQSQPDPLPRSPESIRALARFRGTTIGAPYAEAFRLVRQIID
jgi:LmbE family N-acetylglucosaminyl deacetylase